MTVCGDQPSRGENQAGIVGLPVLKAQYQGPCKCSRVLKVSQESFVTEVLRRFNMSNCKPVPTAIDSGSESVISESDLPSTPAEVEEIADLPFLEVIGCLWVARPDD